MKKIVDTCTRNSDGSATKDAVKLRLRGKGSGYKEGPLNRGNYPFTHNTKNLNLNFYIKMKTLNFY